MINNSNKIHNKLKKKINNSTSIVNLYDSSVFSDFYGSLTTEENFFDDLNFYKNSISVNEKVLEFASGSGRILIPMLKEGYEIIGIEKEKEMVNKMPIEYRNCIVVNDILDFENLQPYYKEANVFIMPATTISLFSMNQISDLIKNIIYLNKKFKFIFDMIDIKNLITKEPNKHVTEKGTFYYTNHSIDNIIAYNILHKESNTLGYSLKFDHNYNDLKDLLIKLGLDVYEEKKINSYRMVISQYKKNEVGYEFNKDN